MKIAIVSSTPTHPTTAGNRARMLSLCDAFNEAGHELHFFWIPDDGTSPDEMPKYFNGHFHKLRVGTFAPHRKGPTSWVRRIQRRLGLHQAHIWKLDSWYDPAITEQLQAIDSIERFDAVVISYVFYSKAFHAFRPEALRILETQERFANRHEIYLRNGLQPEWFSTTIAEESKGLSRADVILSIQENESKYFRTCVSDDIYVAVVNPFLETNAPVAFHSSPRALVMGSANPINVEGVKFLLREVVPLVRTRKPDFRLVLAGDVSKYFLNHDFVESLGRVNQLQDAYSAAAFAINPVQGGTGFCIKSLEALAFGVPLVSTNSGARGMDSIQGPFLARFPDRDAQGLATAIVELLDHPDRVSLGDAAWRAARDWSRTQKQTLLDALCQPPRKRKNAF